MTVARLGYEIDSSGAVKAAFDLKNMSKASEVAEKSSVGLEREFNKAIKATKSASAGVRAFDAAMGSAAKSISTTTSAASVFEAQISGIGDEISKTATESQLWQRELDQTRARFDPLFAASKRYEQELRDISEAEKMGAINSNVAAQARERAAASMASGAVAVNRFSTATAAGASQTANLGAQLNDIGVMLAAGQNPLQLAVQQGTQINQVFAQMGGGRAALRGLAAGFMSMVNPMSLATIGIIAGGAALVQWGISAASAGEEADDLADAMKSIEDSTRSAKLELQAMILGLDNIDQVLLQQSINALEADRARTLNLISAMESDIGAEARRLKIQYELQLKDINEQLKTKREMLQDDIEATDNLEQQNHIIESSNMFLEAQQRLRNEAGAEMERQLKLEQQITDELGNGAVEILKLAGVDLTNIDDASRRAASLASSLGIAFSEAFALANVDFAPLGGGLTPGMSNLLPTAEELRGEPSVGRGGGGTDPRSGRVDAFIKSLQTEREQLTAWYVEQQELLALANASELEVIGGHNEAKLRLEAEYNERKKDLQDEQAQFVANAQANAQGAAMDFLGTLAGQSEGAAKALIAINTGLSIGQAIQNTAVAATRALAELGPIAGPPAAATIKAYGAAQVGLIAANGALRIGRSGGGGGAGSASSAGVTATSATTAPQQTRAIINLQGGRSRFTVEEINDIIRGIQDESDDGVIIEGVTLG